MARRNNIAQEFVEVGNPASSPFLEIKKNKMTDKEIKQIRDNNYSQGAIAMLRMIAKEQGWEESEKYYYDKFFKVGEFIDKSGSAN